MNAALAAAPKNYAISSYTRVSTPAYGGPDANRRREKVTEVRLARSRDRVAITLDALRAGYVYEIRLRNLAGEGQTFHPAEAFYSMTVVPK